MNDKIERIAPRGAITIAPAITQDPVAAYLLSLPSKESKRTQLSALRAVAGLFGQANPRHVEWTEITYMHALALRDRLSSGFGPATARRYFAAFRGVLREAWRLGIFPGDEWRRIDDIDAPKGSSAETGRALSAEEIKRLLDACPDTYGGRREAALVAVSIFAGLRRFEAAGADLADYDDTSGELQIRGKGNKARTVRLARIAREALTEWIIVRGLDQGPLIYGGAKGKRLGYSTVDAIIGRVATRAKVDRFTPHDMRRTFVTRILEMTGDLAIAQKSAGHSKPDTTVKYDKRKSEAVKLATERLDEGIT
jgi:integrase/recombinase XerD